jgi:NitT/TauT family transport system permease protein
MNYGMKSADMHEEHETSNLTHVERGLDALEFGQKSKTQLRARILRTFSPLIALLVLVALWQFLISLKNIPSYILPTPIEVFDSLQHQWQQGALQGALLRSVSRGIGGFALAVAIATPLGLLLGLNKTLRTIFGPILLGLQQLPSVAWVPAAIIWFGLSPGTILVVILLGSVPSISNGLISGIDQIPPLFINVAKVLGANKWEKIYRFILPASWPGFLAGLEQGWAFAWRSLMAAELIAVSPALGIGIGQLLDVGRQLGDMALVIGSIFLIMAVGICIEKIFFAPVRMRTLQNRGLLR